eukprot:gene7720-19822_t
MALAWAYTDDGRLSWGEWQKSTLHTVFHNLDEENDINVSQKTECFSYEHFYMTYEEFVWFCLCEEDKSSQQSLDFWWRCCDLDGDGVHTTTPMVLSGWELAHFFSEQRMRMEASFQDTIAWEDILCQMTDIIKPANPKEIRLLDLKGCRLSGNFFNSLFNLNKFIAFEQRDPFAAHAEKQLPEKTEWDRFAKVEYDRMSHEAGEEDAQMQDEFQGAGGWRADAG